MKTPLPDSARLRIALLDTKPPIWRKVEVPLSMTLTELHFTIQAAFLWNDGHLWDFEVNRTRYGIPFDNDFSFTDMVDSSEITLAKLRRLGISKFKYTYDFGDNWRHSIQVLDYFKMPKDARLPAFISGKRAAPPDDVGGVPGFEMFLEAMADPTHEEHEDLMEWHGDPFDPVDMSVEEIKRGMLRIASISEPEK